MELNVTSKKELEQIVKKCEGADLDNKLATCDNLLSEAEALLVCMTRLTDAVHEILDKKNATT